MADGALEPHASVGLRLAAVTGARRSELAALRWDDLVESRLTVDSSIATLRSPRGRPTLRDDPTKTGNLRTVTLDDSTLSMLSALRAAVAIEGPWILAAGSRPLSPERLSAWWRRARGAAGVDARWRLHDLRHWAATSSIAAGHDVRTVASRLGHANPAMTLRVYAHAVEPQDVQVATTLAALLDAQTEGRHGPQFN
ncbi:MAG TPA: site-specific integrase [Acidimicrobiales bacterium]|nr:site-specific integrase [Acidimicrobiales bacterium]